MPSDFVNENRDNALDLDAFKKSAEDKQAIYAHKRRAAAEPVVAYYQQAFNLSHGGRAAK